jgi:hypothetical protein
MIAQTQQDANTQDEQYILIFKFFNSRRKTEEYGSNGSKHYQNSISLLIYS